MIFSIKPQIFELKCVFSYFRLKTHITLLLPVYVHSWEQRKAIDIADYSKGNGYSKGDLTDAGTPIILYGRLYTKYQFAISEVDTFAVSRNGAVYSQGNEVIVPASGETADDIARASAVEKSGVLLGGDLNILRPFDFINPLFLALAISNGEPQKELAKKAQGKSVVHIHNTDIQEVTIAYPSRTEQDRIVSVFRQLDNLITLHQCKCQIDGCRFQSPLAITWEQRKVREVTDRYDNLR
ncbi:MAG: restriction endonuclease subunit S, partial [Agathobacter rectalis]